MIRGLYTSGWSMLANNKKMDVISNNIANASTNGFKKDTVVFESFPKLLTKRLFDGTSAASPNSTIGNMEFSHDVGEVYTYFNQGNLVNTENRTDLAIDSADGAFFAVGVVGEDGNIRQSYTKDGAFTVNSNNQLVTKDGNYVLGQTGVINLGDSSDFSVTDDGTIIQENVVIDKLMIKQFSNPETLRKYGENLINTTEDTEEENFSGVIRQGFLEESNVNVINEMVNMITVMRAYEANQKMVQTQDSTLEKAVTQVGSVK